VDEAAGIPSLVIGQACPPAPIVRTGGNRVGGVISATSSLGGQAYPLASHTHHLAIISEKARPIAYAYPLLSASPNRPMLITHSSRAAAWIRAHWIWSFRRWRSIAKRCISSESDEADEAVWAWPWDWVRWLLSRGVAVGVHVEYLRICIWSARGPASGPATPACTTVAGK